MFGLVFTLLLASQPCLITAEETARQLALDWEAFDQGPKGFRAFVSEQRYCPRETGELIESYLDAHPGLTVQQRYVSEFHAGQQFAGANDTSRALAHFYRGFNPHEDPAGRGKWNAYVRATIAFLEKDRETLEASYRVLDRQRDNPMNAINLRLVEGFRRAFDGTYGEAVASAFEE
ncbi:MAG TPA: hypothetical protein VD788_17355 [Candidatus Polarisedimenticolaceae bacterium]|nr:hypothetical protein [Candidatus Polarisedimenticolaceae bacterium]